MLVYVFWALSASAQQAEPVLKSLNPQSYPPLARQARIEGKVQLEFFVNHQGEVVAVNVISGHPMLAPAAADNVKSWKFQIPPKAPLDDQRYETTFDFEIADKADIPIGRNAQVSMNTFHEVHVITIGPSSTDVQKSGCPSGKDKEPPTLTNLDYVEMSRSNYKVRIHSDGNVDWEGTGDVYSKGKDSMEIGPTLAEALIAKFASSEFWQLCADYSRGASDSATTVFRISIGGRSKTVSNYASSGPKMLNDLEYAVDETADTHRWLHGEPLEEPLGNIRLDGDGPKPGLTPLMQAVAASDIKAAKKLLSAGADPNQADASGWTVLMYVNRPYVAPGTANHNELVTMLLKAGADADYSSPRGDTPLMAAAWDGSFDQTIVGAGGKINAQNVDGVSALMILASQARADEIGKALQAGANPKLKDTQGRTALDYLRLANCGKRPLPLSIEFPTAISNKCNQLDEDDFHQSQNLLTAATAASVQ